MGHVEKLTEAIAFLDSVIELLPHLDFTKVSKDNVKAYKTFPDQRKSLQIALDAISNAEPGEAYAQACRLFQPELALADEITAE